MEQEVNEEEMKQKSEILHKREQIDNAERKKNEQVTDSQLVRYSLDALLKINGKDNNFFQINFGKLIFVIYDCDT